METDLVPLLEAKIWLTLNPLGKHVRVIDAYVRQKIQGRLVVCIVEPTDQNAPLHDFIETFILRFVTRNLIVMRIPPTKEGGRFSVGFRFHTGVVRIGRGSVHTSGRTAKENTRARICRKLKTFVLWTKPKTRVRRTINIGLVGY